MEDDMAWMDGPQDDETRCAALGAELAYLRGTDVNVSIDDDGIYELEGDIFASRNLGDICNRLEELIAREESKPKAKVLGLTDWVPVPKSCRRRGAVGKPVPVPPVLRSPQVALGMEYKAIWAMFKVGDTWMVRDTDNIRTNGLRTILKVMPKSMESQNSNAVFKLKFPDEPSIIEARPGFLQYNISNGGTVTWTKEA